MVKSVSQKAFFVGPGHSSCFDGLGKGPLSIGVDSANKPGRYAAHYGIGGDVASNDSAGCNDDIVANGCTWKENGIHADEDVIADHNWRNDIYVRTLLSKNPSGTVMGNETHAECQFDVIADRDEVRLGAKSATINSAEFAVLANQNAYATGISNRISFDLPVVSGPCRYSACNVRHALFVPVDSPGRRRPMMAPKDICGNSFDNGVGQ